MSAETRGMLEAAIAAHIADECDGDMTSGWVLVTEISSINMLEEGTGSMFVDSREMQSAYLTEGLLHAALNVRQTDD